MYQVKYDIEFVKSLKKLDKSVTRLVVSYIEKNLINTTDPRVHGKALTGNLRGLWRYRIMDYRLIVKIEDDELIIIALNFQHRSKIYKMKH